MTLVESVRSRWFLGLAAVAFAGSVAAVALQPCPHAATKSVQHRKVSTPRACREWTRTAAPVQRAITGADYRDVLVTAKPALDRCIQKAKRDVTYSLTAYIRMDGTVEKVDVKAESNNLRKVDLKAVQCIESAVSRTKFPAANAPKMVSTTLRRS